MRLLLVTPLLLSGCLAPLGLSPRVPEPTFVPATPLFIDAGYKGRLGQTDALLAIPAPPWEVTVNEAERAFDPPFVDDGEYQRFLRGIGETARRFPPLPYGPSYERERFLTAAVTRSVVRAIDGRATRPEPYAARPVLRDPARDRMVVRESLRGTCRAEIPPRAQLPAGALNVRFVLMLDDVSFGLARGRAAAAPPTMRSLGPGLPAVTEPGAPVYGGGAASELVASARYLIYDYPYERVVACGVARGRSSLENGRIRRIDWDVAMAELGSNVATPF